MLYHSYEVAHSCLQPVHRASAFWGRAINHPLNPLGECGSLRMLGAYFEVVESATRRYDKPEFGISSTTINGQPVAVTQETVQTRPFCDLLHFERDPKVCKDRQDPTVLIVAPMSGHFATLLRDTVRAMLPEHDVYITDWRDARDVPLARGSFGLDDYIDDVLAFMKTLGEQDPGHAPHVIAVCQPAVPVLAATALMAERGDTSTPASLTLMGGPIDTRANPTAVNEHAQNHDLQWFQDNVVYRVPFPNPGWMREVYPGFLQLSGFMAMNLDRHVDAFGKYFQHLVEGDADNVSSHDRFYDEYLSVMDLPAEYFLQTVDRVFHRQALARGEFEYRGHRVDCAAITRTALMTVEGERDDICGIGQTKAAHRLCTNVPEKRRYHFVQPGVGHYGVFNGTRWRTEIQPRIREMIRTVAREFARAQPKTRAKSRRAA